jgi:hypothetical protein
MIDGFITLLAHAALIHHYDVIFPNTTIYKNNATFKGALFIHMLFQGNGEPAGGRCMIKRSDLQSLPFGMGPTNFILVSTRESTND